MSATDQAITKTRPPRPIEAVRAFVVMLGGSVAPAARSVTAIVATLRVLSRRRAPHPVALDVSLAPAVYNVAGRDVFASDAAGRGAASVDLYWLPLGAGGHFGSRWAGRFRIFRYEIRLWLGGHIPDVAEAVDSPRRLTNDEDRARRVLDLSGQVPTPVWGRDELATGDMWTPTQ